MTTSLLRLGSAVLALSVTLSSAAAATLTVNPSADTYFETYGSETKNFGAEPILRLDQWGGRQVFLRFPLTELPRDKHVLRARVKLWVVEVGENEAGELPDLKTCVGLYDVATPWTELGLTYNSPDGIRPWSQGPGIPGPKYADVGPLPAPDTGVHLRVHAIALDPLVVTNRSWLSLDVTEYLRQELRSGNREVNLVLKSSILGRNYTFSSREAKEETQRPRLEVDVDEELPAFHLNNVFETNWTPGRPVNVSMEGWPGSDKRRESSSWTVSQAPRGSRPGAAKIAASTSGGALTADVPGKYVLRFTAKARAAGDDVKAADSDITESASAYLLSVPAHPRLYVTAASLPRLRQAALENQGLSRVFLEWVKRGSSGLPNGKFHDMSIHEGCENNSLAWLLTGDRQYLSNAIAYAQQVLKKPMREHFEDVHAATFLGASWVHAVALHYDWCYDQLTPEHRRAIIAWLKEAARWGWARSGAPIAHNDGGARQCLLGSAALALLGDDPEAEELYKLSHENFEQNLLPWLNDGGSGGRSGDGGEYEGLHGFYIVKYAWMAQTATGEDVFSESPYFFNRLRHILFGWYPRKLVERTGAYSMRQYYSPSGDHIRMGYVGDTQPYQSAAVLCARFRETPAAQAVRWLGGDWPTQWMQYTLRWAVLGEWEKIPAKEPSTDGASAAPLIGSSDQRQDAPVGLAYWDQGCNTVYMRSDWSDNATWILFENSPFVSVHGSLDSGTFEIFKGDLLAARTGNLDYANVGAPHTMNYLHRTISGNCLLIEDPAERWKGFLGGAEGAQDGGGERTNFPLTSSADADNYRIYREVFQRGQITRFRTSNEFTFAEADLTPAYNNPRFHGGKLNQPKVRKVTRQLLYLRGLDSVLVFDRVSSIRPEFKKAWLLHSLGDLDVTDGKGTAVADGEIHYEGATQAVLRYGWPKPVPSFGRCLSVTLFPEHALVSKIGGRVELPPGKTEAFAADQWHGQHQHHHVRDFWVNGTNYPPGDPPEIRWFGEPTSQYYIPGTPDESGGRGKWRLEVRPPAPALDDVFFHVLCPRLGEQGSFPTVTRIVAEGLANGKAPGTRFDGALVQEGEQQTAVFFAHGDEPASGINVRFPDRTRPALLIVSDLVPGHYRVTGSGVTSRELKVGDDGVAVFPQATGQVRMERVSGGVERNKKS